MSNRSLSYVLLAALAGAGLPARIVDAQHPSEFTRRDKTEIFIQHLVKVLRLDPSQYEAMVLEYEIGSALAEVSKEIADELQASDFIQSSLAELYPAYARALETFRAGKDIEARVALSTLDPALHGGKPNPYVEAYASLLEAEIDFRAGKYEEVVQRCEELGRTHRQRLIADHRACELIALSFQELGKPLLEYAQYAILLTDFTELPREVGERAKARIAVLGEEYGRPLHTVAGWMNRVEKLLSEEVTAKEPTQEEEDEIIAALDKLIELQEAIERQTCSGCGGNCKGACKNGTPKGNRSNSPAQVSKLPPRGEGIIDLRGVSRASRETIWGVLREKDASQALKSFGGKLPPRYERLLEKYYEALSKDE